MQFIRENDEMDIDCKGSIIKDTYDPTTTTATDGFRNELKHIPVRKY